MDVLTSFLYLLRLLVLGSAINLRTDYLETKNLRMKTETLLSVVLQLLS